LLRVLAGLRTLGAGRVDGVPARKSFVFQDAALLPWLTLRQNVALPGRFGKSGDPAAAIAEVDLSEHADKLPRALSGGQRMRASLARALVAEPELVLLDEAFAALDGMTRRAVQRSFLRLAEAHAWTVVMVTHELEDAVRLADRVVAVDGPPLRIIADVPIPLGRPRDLADARAPALVEDVERAIAGLDDVPDPEPTEERPR
jgi:NitT/TauT family transport system ATP-binding protein